MRFRGWEKWEVVSCFTNHDIKQMERVSRSMAWAYRYPEEPSFWMKMQPKGHPIASLDHRCSCYIWHRCSQDLSAPPLSSSLSFQSGRKITFFLLLTAITSCDSLGYSICQLNNLWESRSDRLQLKLCGNAESSSPCVFVKPVIYGCRYNFFWNSTSVKM